jgi:hypothetical protein
MIIVSYGGDTTESTFSLPAAGKLVKKTGILSGIPVELQQVSADR